MLHSFEFCKYYKVINSIVWWLKFYNPNILSNQVKAYDPKNLLEEQKESAFLM